MALSRSKDGINDEDRRILRLFKVIQCEGSETLRHVFKWGCKKSSSEPLTTYLINKGWTNRVLKNRFDNTMQDKIANDPIGDTYDISLLWTCIKSGCEGLASDGKPEWKEGNDCIESICTFTKNIRNKICHGIRIPDDKFMKDLCNDFEDKLKKLISLAGDKYNHKDEIVSLQNVIEDSIRKIMDAPVDITEYLKQLVELREEQNKILEEKCRAHLPERYKTMSKVDPASFISGKERLEVKKVFVQLEVILKSNISCTASKNPGDSDKNIDCMDILELRTQDEVRPAIILVEGDAGAGKTTFAKLILNDWANMISDGTLNSIHGLDYFDLVLYAEGRNKHISSFLDLLRVLMPHAAAKLADEDLVRSVLNNKVLLIIDGLDELNPASKALVTELLDRMLQQSAGKLHLLLSTRPQMLPELPSTIKNHTLVHTRLKGISPDMLEEFVTKLHEEMKKDGQSTQDTSLLIDFVRQSRAQLGEHFRLPLNLTLLTYLWAADPKLVNSVTTTTDLYIALHKLVQSRLVTRLLDHGSLSGKSRHDIEKLCGQFLDELYNACLETLKTGYMQLSDTWVHNLRKKCTDLNLKFEEMTEPFLCIETEWEAFGCKFDLFVPHKSIMEFYAAYRFLFFIVQPYKKYTYFEFLNELQIKSRKTFSEKEKENLRTYFETDENSRQSLHELVQNLLDKNLSTASLSEFHNVFLHLGGLLAHQEDTSLLEQYAEDLVLAMEQTDMRDYQRLNLVTETKCNDKVASHVAPHMKKLSVRDGHTGTALAILPYLPSSTCMDIILEAEVKYVPRLKELLNEVADRDCYLEFLLKHQWKNSTCGTSDKFLLPLITEDAKCSLERLTAYLDDIKSLPHTVTDLRLSIISDTHATKILDELRTKIEQHYFSLNYLGLHILPDVEGNTLTQLPRSASLWLSGVNDDGLERAVKVIKILFSKQQCNSLFFPRGHLSSDGVENLITKLSEAEVKWKTNCRLYVTCPTLTEKKRLKQLTKDKLNCDLFLTDGNQMW